MVISAPKSTSNTLSNPAFFRAETIFPITSVPGGISNNSPSVALIDGAVCAMTCFFELLSALITSLR